MCWSCAHEAWQTLQMKMTNQAKETLFTYRMGTFQQLLHRPNRSGLSRTPILSLAKDVSLATWNKPRFKHYTWLLQSCMPWILKAIWLSIAPHTWYIGGTRKHVKEVKFGLLPWEVTIPLHEKDLTKNKFTPKQHMHTCENCNMKLSEVTTTATNTFQWISNVYTSKLH